MKPILSAFTVWLILLGCSNPSWAQERFALSVDIMPFYSHSDAKRNTYFPDYATSGPPILTQYSVRSVGDGYSVGLLGRYSFSTQWSATTGIWLSHTWFQVPTIVTDPHIDIETTSSRSRNYLIPLLVNYQATTKRLAPYFSVGLLLSFRALGFIPTNGGQEAQIRSGGKLLTVIPLVGAGIIYQLNSHFSLIIQPTFRYSIPDSDVIYAHYYQVGLQSQVLYKF